MSRDDWSQIPDEMKALPQWVCWNADKVPISPRNGRAAKAGKPETWGTFKQACGRAKAQNLGIGFEFAADDPYCGIDLDKCRDPETGELEDWADAIVQSFDSYMEVSPSGTGVHIIIRASKPERGKSRTNYVEIYDSGRYFTMTGECISGHASICDQQDQLMELLEDHGLLKDSQERPERPKAATATPLSDDDTEVLERCRKHSPAKFPPLWEGDISGYVSYSEADLALVNILTWNAGGNREQTLRLWQQSGLWREKCEREDYRNWTLDKAAESGEFYNPGRRSQREQTQPKQTQPKQDKADETRQEKPNLGFDEMIHNTDLGNAQRLVQRFGEDIRYLDSWRSWFLWDGHQWKQDDTRQIERYAKGTVRGMYREAADIDDDDERKFLIKWARKSEAKSRLDAMVQLARSEPGIPILHDQLDKDPMILNVANGVIDLSDGTLHEPDRKRLITKIAPVVYDASATCPTWDAFLDRIMDHNADLIAFLQRAAGYSLTGLTNEQCLFFMYGTGRNGKTTFVETLKALMGDYAKKAPSEIMMAQRYSGGASNEIAALRGARLVCLAEVEEGRRLSESMAKDLTGDDTIHARFLYQEGFDFKPQHKIWMYGNHKPVIRGTDEGIWSRIPLIPFTVYIPRAERDPSLPGKLLAELPGILRWAVEGCLEWQRGGIQFPKEILAATQEYRSEMDVLGAFIEDCCVIHTDAQVTSRAIYAAYTEWCERNGEKPIRKNLFGQRLKERGFEATKGAQGVRGWQGIGLLVDGESGGTGGAGEAVLHNFETNFLRKGTFTETTPPVPPVPPRNHPSDPDADEEELLF